MLNIDEILRNPNYGEVVSILKSRSNIVPSWGTLLKDYEPSFHSIVKDRKGRRDKVHSDGTVDEASRLSVGLEKLLTSRMTEFTFSIPVKRVYSNTDTDTKKEIATAIEKIYTTAHIDFENLKRGKEYYASCEILSLWYTKREPNTIYGFPSEYKLKCKTFSPMSGVRLYPLFDEFDDLIAMSFEYEKTVATETVTYFETFTSSKHFKWSLNADSSNSNGWQVLTDGEEIAIEKIPAIYLYRNRPVWDGLQKLREDIEYTISRNSDVIAYNSAPVLKVSGSIVGAENKGETRRIYRVTEGGDVSYVSWAQSTEALKYHVDTLVKMFFMQAQMPDISFENMKSLGNIGYDSRKTLLTDAHLKIGEESGPWIQFLERETNVIKAFLKKMNVSWSSEIDDVHVEHIITPFVQEDEKSEIEKLTKANGGKALISQLDSIKLSNLSSDPDQTLKEIQQEELIESSNRASGMMDMFSAQ